MIDSIRPAPSWRPSGWEMSFSNQLLAYLSICRCQLCIPVVQLIFQLQVADQQSGICNLLTGPRPRDTTLTTLWLHYLSFGCPRGYPKIHWNFNTSPGPPKITKMVSQGLPNPPKWGPKTPLETPESWKYWKSEISQKPLFFVWFQHIRASNSDMNSIPKSLKNQHWHPYHPFDSPNHENTKKFTKNWSLGGSQNLSKIIKNP